MQNILIHEQTEGSDFPLVGLRSFQAADLVVSLVEGYAAKSEKELLAREIRDLVNGCASDVDLIIGGRRLEADVRDLNGEQELIVEIDGHKAAAFNITGIIPC